MMSIGCPARNAKKLKFYAAATRPGLLPMKTGLPSLFRHSLIRRFTNRRPPKRLQYQSIDLQIVNPYTVQLQLAYAKLLFKIRCHWVILRQLYGLLLCTLTTGMEIVCLHTSTQCRLLVSEQDNWVNRQVTFIRTVQALYSYKIIQYSITIVI